MLAVHLLQQFVQRLGGVLVQIARRLVGQQERRPHDERAGNGDALLLAARQHPGPVLQPLGQPDTLEEAAGSLATLGGALPRDSERHLGVLDGRKLGQQVMKLKDEPDVPVAKCHQRLVGEAGEIHLVDADRAGIRRFEPAEDVEKRAFADARRSHDGHHVAALERELEILEHGQMRAADGVAFRQSGDGDERHQLSAFSYQLSALSFLVVSDSVVRPDRKVLTDS